MVSGRLVRMQRASASSSNSGTSTAAGRGVDPSGCRLGTTGAGGTERPERRGGARGGAVRADGLPGPPPTRVPRRWSELLLLAPRQLGEDVTAREHEEVLTADRHLGAAVLGVEHHVAHRDVDGDDVAGLLGPPARA